VRECVSVRERESVRECVCVCVRERERECTRLCVVGAPFCLLDGQLFLEIVQNPVGL